MGVTVTAAHITAADATTEVQVSTLEAVLHVLTNSISVQNLFLCNKDLDILRTFIDAVQNYRSF